VTLSSIATAADRPRSRNKPVDVDALVAQRRQRLHDVMRESDVPAILTADPFSIRYATGTRNMLVHGMTGPDRLALVVADGPTVLWEFAGCEHLSEGSVGIDEVRSVPSLSAKKSVMYLDEATSFAHEVVELCRRFLGDDRRVAIERLDPPVVDAIRAKGIVVLDATEPMQQAMSIKQPAEIDAMRAAMAMTEAATTDLERAIEPGRTEQEVWAEFHRTLIALGGELVVTRLLQAGVRTFPYFQEASDHVMHAGDLVCFDTDAVGLHGYSVDFSRTFLCGDGDATSRQRELHALALEQLLHNAANLQPGRSFEEFARRAFDVPEPHRQYGYYQLAHGLGLAGGHPNVPRLGEGRYPLPGEIEPGMVICVESYVGDPDSSQGVKLEDQFLVTDDGVDCMSTHPFSASLITPGV
jgi:Xaa-Pro aminopeptidase